MKVNFQSITTTVKNLPWAKYGNYTKKAAKILATGYIATIGIVKCSQENTMLEQEKATIRREIKNTDIDRYNRINESIVSGEKHDVLSLWLNERAKMNDSISIAERAYFEGAQKVRDSHSSTIK